MIAQQRHQESLSNNIANANTPGYKADQATLRSFPEMLLRQMGTKTIPTTKGLQLKENNGIGSLTTGVYAQESIPNFEQGPIRETGIPTDFAIVDGNKPEETGGIFFTVQNEAGETRYTRNGHFTVDGEGFLTTNGGLYVLDQAGNPIQTNNLDFTVTTDGIVQVNGANIPLGIVYVSDVNDLVKEGHDLLRLEAGAAEAPAQAGAGFTLLQHTLEGSNVNPMQSMTDMIVAYRSFEQNQRVLKAYDESMGKAVNEIARLG